MIRIVIAEDEEDVRTRLAKYLDSSNKGYVVVGQAEDGEQALSMVQQLHPDLLMTDICMPQLSGLEMIRAVRQTDQELPIIIVSGYDEFSYAKEAISLGVREYLLKPFLPNELFAVLDKTRALLEQRAKAAAQWQAVNEELQKNMRYTRQRFFHSLLRGRLSEQEKEATAEAIGFDLRADWFCAGMLDCEAINPPELEQLWQQLPDVPPMYAIPGEQTHITVFFHGPGKDPTKIQARLAAALEPLCLDLQNRSGAPVRCTLGRPCQDCDDLARSYKEAVDTWRVNFAQGELVQLYPLDPGGVLRPKERIAALSGKLLLDVQMGDKAGAMAGLEELMQLYADCSPVLAGQISVGLLKLVMQIAELMRDAGEQELAWIEQNLIGYLRQHFSTVSLREAHTMLRGYLDRCCDYFARRNAADSDKLIYRARIVIEENLGNEDFDLEILAQNLFFSPTYVRQLFKTKMGENFSDYLFRRRMETAGQLMGNQSLKVQDIAERTGYKDPRYFARCFKKFYHCTPTEYRARADAF